MGASGGIVVQVEGMAIDETDLLRQLSEWLEYKK